MQRQRGALIRLRRFRPLRGRRCTSFAAAAAWAAVTSGCGYHAVYGAAPAERLHVALVRSLVADAVVADEVATGVREELAREGALAAGEGWPRVEVEVLRTTTASEGIAAAGLPGGATAPEARGIAVDVVARAWLVGSPGGVAERDTGDMAAQDVVTVDRAVGALDLRGATFHGSDAARAAARRLGERLGRRVLGGPAASEP